MVFDHCAVDEPDVPPSDDLVKEGFNRLQVDPTTLVVARRWEG